MDRKSTWIIAGSVIVASLLFTIGQRVSAQRIPDEGPSGPVGRYQVVRATPDIIILLDTATGDLYNAVPSDIKPYKERRGGGVDWAPKDRPAKDKDFVPPRRFPRDSEKKDELKKDPDFPRDRIERKDPLDDPTKKDFKKDDPGVPDKKFPREDPQLFPKKDEPPPDKKDPIPLDKKDPR